jgi:hypothetical protein
MDSPITPRFESQGTPAKELIRTRRKALGDAWRKQSASQVDRRRLPEGYCRRRGERRRGVAAGSGSSKSRRRRNVKGAIRLVARKSRLRRQRSEVDGRLVPAHSSGRPVRDHRPPPRHARSGAGWDVRPAPRRRCSTAGASRRWRRVDPAGMTPARIVKVRKHHVMVDTGGRALVIQAHPANVQVRDGAISALKGFAKILPLH